MRVSDNSNFGNVMDTIQRSKSRMEKLQTEASSMKKLNRPSDDPIAAAKILEIRTDKTNNKQFEENARMAEAFLNNTDHALSELSDIALRAKEIALGQASGASSNDDTRLGVGEEVAQLFSQAIVAANRRIGDRYLFGGYKTDRPPVDNEGRYLGDNGQMMAEISRGVFIGMNVPGIDAFNTNPKDSSDGRRMGIHAPELEVDRGPATIENENAAPTENVNIFDELQNLRISLLTGDLEGIRTTLDRFDQIHAKLVATRAKVGSRVQGLEGTHTALEKHDVTHAQLASALEDADMTQVMSDLAKEETVYRTTLASAQKLLQPTLLQFLK